jgi:DHA1 family tetracycline resistance protein-like MFS transporter
VEDPIKIEKTLTWSLIFTSLGIFTVLIKSEWLMWTSVIPAAMGGGLFYMALLTLFSNAVDENSQGWVMGVSAAIMSVAWALTGLLSGALGILGLFIPFLSAGCLLLVSAAISKLSSE